MENNDKKFAKRLAQIEFAVQGLEWDSSGKQKRVLSQFHRFNKRFIQLSKGRRIAAILTIITLIADYFITPASWSAWALLPAGAYLILLSYALILNEIRDVYATLGLEEQWDEKKTKSNNGGVRKTGPRSSNMGSEGGLPDLFD